MAGLTPPANVHVVRARGAVAWTVPTLQAWVTGALTEGTPLYDLAGRAVGALELRGRGPVYAVPSERGRWVVRHCRRGGALGPVLGDRFLRGGPPRPFREMHASWEARRRGIPTPRVLAAVVYPSGAFYRGDVVSEYVPEARDLASLLFGVSGPDGRPSAEPPLEDPERRTAALKDAAYLLGRMARAGVDHPDLNAKNVLLEAGSRSRGASLVDLDKARIAPPGQAVPSGPMRERLQRSLRKFEAASGRSLTPAEWAALAEPATDAASG